MPPYDIIICAPSEIDKYPVGKTCHVQRSVFCPSLLTRILAPRVRNFIFIILEVCQRLFCFFSVPNFIPHKESLDFHIFFPEPTIGKYPQEKKNYHQSISLTAFNFPSVQNLLSS